MAKASVSSLLTHEYRDAILTIIDVENKQSLAFSHGGYDVHAQLISMFFDLPAIALIICIRSSSLWIRSEVDIEIVDDIREERKSCAKGVAWEPLYKTLASSYLLEGSLISSPSGVPTKENFFPGTRPSS